MKTQKKKLIALSVIGLLGIVYWRYWEYYYNTPVAIHSLKDDLFFVLEDVSTIEDGNIVADGIKYRIHHIKGFTPINRKGGRMELLPPREALVLSR